MKTAGLLFLSNLFMTTAWYGHLRFRHASILSAILVSWLLALPEYALQVPANRLGYGALNAYQLKILQECITLFIFIGFAWLVLGEPLKPQYALSFGLVLAAVGVAFYR
ncbi:DMT family protein [Bdellovibrionota bacterium FG-1]